MDFNSLKASNATTSESWLSMLQDFLLSNQKEILDLCHKKSRYLAGSHQTSEQLNQGLPLFFEQLINVLNLKMSPTPPKDMLKSAALHGKEFLRLGYTLSHVVHSYGAMCQAITELATMKDKRISAEEFNILNGCLDVSIASAVSEYEYRSNLASEEREVKHLGYLAHELRNALSSATIANGMIRAGLVGTGGSTAMVLEESLTRMSHLIDRSLSEVRMRTDSDVCIEIFNLSVFFDQIMITAKVDGNKKKQNLQTVCDSKIEVETDRQYLLSAVANVIQNAIKYTHSGGTIVIKGVEVKDKILISVTDECGGISEETLKTIFDAHSKANSEKGGLGLGLSISKKAIEQCQGSIRVDNTPGQGCVFTIELPRKLIPIPRVKISVPGTDSIQPDFTKK